MLLKQTVCSGTSSHLLPRNIGSYICLDLSGESNLDFFHLIFQIIAVVPPHFFINRAQMIEKR